MSGDECANPKMILLLWESEVSTLAKMIPTCKSEYNVADGCS